MTNRGPNDSEDALFTYSLPAGVSLVSVESELGSFIMLDDQVLIEMGEVGVWSVAEARVHLMASEAGSITSRVEVASAELDWDLSNNAAVATTEVKIDNDVLVGLSVGSLEGLVGRDLEYEIGVTNLGPHEAELVEMLVEWSGPVELVSVEPSQGDWTAEEGVLRVVIGALDVGADAGVRLVVRALEDGLLTNVVRVSSGELDLALENNVAEGVVQVARLVDLGVVQDAGAAEVLLGQVLRIGVGVTNAGPSVASGVRVFDELALGMELVEVEVSQGEWTNGAGGLEWEVGTLGVGEGARMEIGVRMLLEGWTTNVVRAVGDEVEGEGSDNESQVEVLVVPAADLGLELNGEPADTVVLGTQASYELVVRNGGLSHASGVVLEGRLGEGLELVGVGLEWYQWSVEDGLVRCELGVLGVDEFVEVELVVRGVVEGVWTNLFDVRGVEADGELQNNSVEWVTAVRRETDLAVGLSVGTLEGLVGRDLEYEIGVTNLGPHEAELVEVLVEWSGPVELVSVEPSQGDWTAEEGVLRVVIGALGVGADAGVRLVVSALEDGLLTNVVRVASGELDLAVENNVAEGVVQVARLVDLGVVQDAGAAEVLLGQVLRIGVGVTNAGPSVASGVRVFDELALGMELVEVEVTQGEWTNGAGGLEWEVGTLGVGEGARMEIGVRMLLEGWTTNVVRAVGDEIEGEESDNESRAEVLVVPAADLGLELSGEPTATVVLGTEASYELVVRNGGLSQASGVVLEGRLGEGLELVSVGLEAEQWSVEDGLVRCELGVLGVDEVVTVGLVARGTVVGLWTNRFEVRGEEADGELGNNLVEWVTAVRKQADLAVGLSVGTLEGLVGRDLEYEIGVTNLGPHEAELVEVLVEWSGKVEFVSVEPSQGDWTAEGGVLRVEIGALDVGADAGVRLVVRASEDGLLTNVVRVASGELDLAVENNVVEGVVQVARLVDLGVVQDAGAAEVLLGQVLRIGVGVTNAGPSVASGVRVFDELALGMELVEVEVSQGEWTNGAGGLEWEVGTLGVGEGARMEIGVRMLLEGWTTNVVRAVGDEIEGEESDNESRAEVLVVPAADLGLELSGEPTATVVLGTEASYELVVRNGGLSQASGVVLEGRLGEGLELVSVGLEAEQWSVEDGLVRCELGVLGVDEVVTVGLVVRGAVEGVWVNQFEVWGVEADAALENNLAEWVTAVRKEADLAVGLSVGTLEGLVGRDLEYEIGVTNLGFHAAELAEFAVEWFGKVEVVSVELSVGEWVQSASQLVWTMESMPPGSEARARVIVSPLRAGEVLTEVLGTTATFDSDPGNNIDSVSVTVLDPADLGLEQSADRVPVLIGDRLTYTISVRNRGDYEVDDVQLMDELPEGVELASTIASQGIVLTAPGVIEWSLGALEPGANASLLATVIPLQAGPLTNRVMLFSAYVDPEDPGLVSETVIEAVTTPPLTITSEGSRVVLAWPAIAEGYRLEASDGLTFPMVWVLDGNPQEPGGDRITVTVKVTNGRRFYRLMRP